MVTDKFNQTTFTVAELIVELQKMPQDAPVYTEGCDCIGTAVGVEIQQDGDVWITRDN